MASKANLVPHIKATDSTFAGIRLSVYCSRVTFLRQQHAILILFELVILTLLFFMKLYFLVFVLLNRFGFLLKTFLL